MGSDANSCNSEVPTVFFVDDDQSVRRAFLFLANSVGLQVELDESATEFLDAYSPDRAGCLVLDVRMPKMSGLELQDQLNESGTRIPIIFISGHADVRMAARAFRAGAFDFVEKPVNNEELLERIEQAFQHDAVWRESTCRPDEIAAHVADLTSEERETLHLITVGKTVQQIAAICGVSAQTVSQRQARVLEKMQVQNVWELTQRLNSRKRGDC